MTTEAISKEAVTERLARVNWDFPRSKGGNDTINAMHWFAGNYIPQIPSYLMQILSHQGDTILDPFGGSGTTAIEGARIGRRVFSGDSLEMCTFLTASKLAVLASPPSKQEVASILGYLALPELRPGTLLGTGLEDWYSKDTLGELGFINELVSKTEGSLRSLLEVAFSNTLFICASPGDAAVTSTGLPRRHHWGWIADNVKPKTKKYHPAAAVFQYELLRFQTSHDLFGADTEQAFAVRHDARKMPFGDNSIDCIVTSPPYIGMIDYAKSHRLTYMWKGWNVNEDRSDEIGARFKRARNQLLNEYIDDMSKCLSEMYRVLRQGAYCALVIGESRAFSGTASSLLRSSQNGLSLVWGPTLRTSSRRRVSDRLGREGVEQLWVFQKQ